MKNSLLGISLLFSLLIGTPVHAADLRMDEVVISASRIETSVSKVSSGITVISEEDLDALQIHTLGDALQGSSGVFMGNAQGPAGVNTVMIRGAKSRYTQFRFNGIPLRETGSIEGNYDALLGSFNFAQGAVNRIEILKGAQSTLYGSSAVGGVISIYPGKRWDSGFGTSIDLSGGSYGTFTASGQIFYGDDKSYVNFSPLFTTSDGHQSVWYDQGGFTLAAGIRLSQKTTVELSSLLTAFEGASFDSPWFTGTSWSKLSLYDDALKTSGNYMLNGVVLTHEFSPCWSVQGKAAFTMSDRNYRHYGSEYLGNSHYLELLNTFRLREDLTILAGAEYEGQAMELRSYGSSALKENAGSFSAYAKALLSFLDKNLVLSAGSRFCSHEDYDEKSVWDLGISYSFEAGTRLYGNISTGFYTPSLFQRYGDGGWTKANPELEPETSLSFEIGAEQKLWDDRILLSAALFATEFDDQVAYDYAGSRYYNADQAKTRGLELGFSIQPSDIIRFELSYLHVSAKQKTSGGNWTHGFQIPDDKASASVYVFPREKLTLAATARWEGERKDASGNVMDDAFFTVDLSASYALTDQLQIYAKVRNLLDEDYAVYGWEMPGINATLGMRFTF